MLELCCCRARQIPFLFGVLAALAVSPFAVQGDDELRPMTIVDQLEVPILSEPRLAPDGEEALFVLAEGDWKENKRISHIWRASRHGGEDVQLTYGKEGQSSPRWSPDGRWIAFLTQRGEDEEEQIFLLPRSGGEAFRLTHHPTAVSRIAWSPGGEGLYFLATDEKTEEETKKEELQDDVFAFDEDYQQKHLWRVHLPEKLGELGQEERLTEGDYSILRFQPSRNGKKLVVHRAPSPLFDDSDEAEVWVLESDGSGGKRLTTNSVFESGGSLSPDGSTVLFLSGSNSDFESYYNDNLFLVPAAGGASRLLLPELPYDIQSARWSRDGDGIFFTANTGVRTELFRVAVETGTVQQLTEGDHSFRGWNYVADRDEHVLAIDTATNHGDLWLLSQGGEMTRLSRRYDYLKQKFALPHHELVSWKGADGQDVEGLLTYPVGYQEGKRYPLVVQTHGGPAASDKFGFGRWTSYIPVLAGRGWLVFRPNYRGSTGYGDAFLRDMVGHYYNQAHLDVLAGVDFLVAEGLADPDRMVKMGWSAGGHMTNKVITVTDRFKAASSGAGAVNWISMYGQSDVRIYRTPWFGGTPWQENAPIEVYWDHSPLKDISKVKTPTLVLVGQNDVRVPMPQSVELYRALRSNGVPTKLYVAPREPHGWRELRHEMFKLNVEIEWFERWALGKEYEWEKAPDLDESQSQPSEVDSTQAVPGDEVSKVLSP